MLAQRILSRPPEPLFRLNFGAGRITDHLGRPASFSRGGSATQIMGGRLITREAAMPRFWHEVQSPVGVVTGLLLEPTATNVVPGSLASFGTRTTSAIVTDGTLASAIGVNPRHIVKAAGAGNNSVYGHYNAANIISEGAIAVRYAIVRNLTARYVGISSFRPETMNDDSAADGSRWAGFDLQNGVTTNSPNASGRLNGSGILPIANNPGWWLIWAWVNAAGSSANLDRSAGLIILNESGTAAKYNSADTTRDFLVAHFQTEMGYRFPTSVIPTSGSAVARATDALTYAYAGLPQAAGETWFLELASLGGLQPTGQLAMFLMVGTAGTGANIDDGLRIRTNTSNDLVAGARVGGTTFASTVALSTLGANVGDRIRLLLTIFPDGANHRSRFSWQKNNGAWVEEAPSDAFTLPAAWSNPLVSIGSVGNGAEGAQGAYCSVLGMPGVHSGAQMAHWNEVLP